MGALWGEKNLLFDMLKLGLRPIPSSKAPITEFQTTKVNMKDLPALTGWHLDSHPFVTLPLVYTEHPGNKSHNLGMYRIELREEKETGMHWQIHKGGGFHHYEAERRNQSLPVSLFIGGPPILTITAIAPLPEMVPEMVFASLLLGDKLTVAKVKGCPHPLIAEAEYAFIGEVPPHVRKPEGPFGDHYGYYSLAHDFPVFQVHKMFRRKDAIYPATVVGKPRQEDYFIGEYLQRLMSPLYPVVMNGVREIWAYAESGVHALAGAIVRESYYKEGLAHALRIMGEGQLTLTKFLMVTNKRVTLAKFPELMEAILERFMPERDLLILTDTSMDTLDYTGRKFNTGSKAIMTGLGEPIRELARTYNGGHIPGIRQVNPYCGGCLVIAGASYDEDKQLPDRLIKESQEQLREWQLVFLVDDADIVRSQQDFIWTTFTRFDPAHDLYAKANIVRNNIQYKGPLIIDARMKPFYPEEVKVLPEIDEKVSARWKEYFPNGLKGNS